MLKRGGGLGEEVATGASTVYKKLRVWSPLGDNWVLSTGLIT